jgi:hypothetical protein
MDQNEDTRTWNARLHQRAGSLRPSLTKRPSSGSGDGWSVVRLRSIWTLSEISLTCRGLRWLGRLTNADRRCCNRGHILRPTYDEVTQEALRFTLAGFRLGTR